jgi:hypothetical protein
VQPYVEAYPVGTRVVVAPLADLEEFRAGWHLHNPIVEEQLPFAGKSARVRSVGFYHGGDVLYVLWKVPGVWHEVCLKECQSMEGLRKMRLSGRVIDKVLVFFLRRAAQLWR